MSCARVQTYSSAKIGACERHVERKNKDYGNVNVEPYRIPMNVHFKDPGEKSYMDILRERLWNYLDQLFVIQKRHNSQNCYVVIGEILSGLIHHELRIENNENVVEQFIYVSSLLSEFLAEVSKKFNKVYVQELLPIRKCLFVERILMFFFRTI